MKVKLILLAGLCVIASCKKAETEKHKSDTITATPIEQTTTAGDPTPFSYTLNGENFKGHVTTSGIMGYHLIAVTGDGKSDVNISFVNEEEAKKGGVFKLVSTSQRKSGEATILANNLGEYKSGGTLEVRKDGEIWVATVKNAVMIIDGKDQKLDGEFRFE